MNDCTIIGAGPAGSMSALLLARRGVDVRLIEQHRFPRDKVCGECLSAVGVAALDRHGLLQPLLDAGGVILNRAAIHSAAGASIETLLPRPMLGISRHVMDAMLLESACDAGARLCQPARCEGIFAPAQTTAKSSAGNRPDPVRVRVRDLKSNTVQTLPASLVVLADGKSALPGAVPPATGDLGIKSHWTGVVGPPDAIELFGCHGCYGGLAPIEGNRWNAAFSVPADRLRAHRGNIDSLFAELMRENHSLADRFSSATRSSPWLASPLPRFGVNGRWTPGIIPVGNAAAALEPIGGEGMGMALRSAELAAEAIAAAGGVWRTHHANRLRRAYEKLWRVRRVACRTAAMVVSNGFTADVALGWGQRRPALFNAAMRWMGKESDPRALGEFGRCGGAPSWPV